MAQANRSEAPIAFPSAGNPAVHFMMMTRGLRVNGSWVVDAVAPPRPVRYAEAPRIGQIVLNPGSENATPRELEPQAVNDAAHAWVGEQAAVSGLHIVQHETAVGSNIAEASYLIGPAPEATP